MIIKFDNSVIDCIENNDDIDGKIFFDDFCTAVRRGNFCFDITKQQIRRLVSSSGLSDLQRCVLKSLNVQITYSNELHELIKYRLFFYNSKYAVVDSIDSYDIAINISDYYSSYSLNGKTAFNIPRLVVENPTDYDVYECIINWYKNNCQIAYNNLFKFEIVNGGGDTSAEVCKNLSDDGYIVYCICDSDKKYPGDNIYQTAKKLKDFLEYIGKPGNLIILEAQEVENFIPLCVLNMTARDTQKPAIEFYEHVLRKSDTAIFYIDLKNGFNYKQVFIDENDFSNYWRSLFTDFKCTFYEAQLSKIISGEIPNESNIVTRLSSMLPHAIENMKSFDHKMNQSCLLSGFWERIGYQLFSWGCGSKAIKI